MRTSSVLFTAFAVLVLVSLNAPAQTNAIQIPVQGTNNTLPKVNDIGEMVWTSRDDAGEWDVFYFDGRATTRLLTPYCFDRFPQINNNGQIVWEGFDSFGWGIYLNDMVSGLPPQRITSTSVIANNPQINNSGDVVYEAAGRSGAAVYLYRNGVTTQLSPPGLIACGAQLNDNSTVVWTGYWYGDNDWDIYMCDTLTTPVTVSRIDHLGFVDNMPPSINENGDIAWASSPDQGTSWDIVVWDGTEAVTLSTPDCNERVQPQISDEGTVTWCGFDGTDWEVFLFEGDTVIQLTDNDLDDMSPQVSSEGEVVWLGDDGNDWEVFAYKDSVITQLTDNDLNETAPQVNIEGDIVWMGSDGSNTQIYVSENIADTTPPTISSVVATPNILWPANHKMVPVSIEVTATDEEDADPACRIASVTCNEPDVGEPDWIITGDLDLELRAERLGCSTGRVYTITVECSDESGNLSSSQVTVTVPHDCKKKCNVNPRPARERGPLFHTRPAPMCAKHTTRCPNGPRFHRVSKRL